MLSRALSLATVTLLIGCFAAPSAWAQAQNLEAGKSASQLFAGTCNACHKSPRGLLKTVSAGSLPGFLRQHYTTSSDMASQLSTFLISNGASDTRYQAKQGADAKPAGGTEQIDRQGRRSRPAPSQEAARPDADATARRAKPAVRAATPSGWRDPASHPTRRACSGRTGTGAGGQRARPRWPQVDGQATPEQARQAGRRRTANGKDEPAKPEPEMDDKAKAETAKEDSGKPEGTKPAGEGKSISRPSRAMRPRSSRKMRCQGKGAGAPVLRPDPVPPVTPAPPAAIGWHRPSGAGAAALAASSGAGSPAPAPSAPAAATGRRRPPAASRWHPQLCTAFTTAPPTPASQPVAIAVSPGSPRDPQIEDRSAKVPCE